MDKGVCLPRRCDRERRFQCFFSLVFRARKWHHGFWTGKHLQVLVLSALGKLRHVGPFVCVAWTLFHLCSTFPVPLYHGGTDQFVPGPSHTAGNVWGHTSRIGSFLPRIFWRPTRIGVNRNMTIPGTLMDSGSPAEGDKDVSNGPNALKRCQICLTDHREPLLL